jgi:hypothetical protein
MKSGHFKTCGMALIVGLLSVTSTIVHANVFEVTFTGTVSSGTDISGIFAPAGTDMTGASFVSHYAFDTSLGTHDFDGAIGPGLLGERVAGGTAVSTSFPALAASITINGVTFSISGNYDAGLLADCLAPCTPGSGSGFGAAALGSANGPDLLEQFTTTNLLLSRLLSFSYSLQPGDHVSGSEFALSSSGTTLFLAESAVTLSETPLPAALPLFVTGLGALGVIGRRRKLKTSG